LGWVYTKFLNSILFYFAVSKAKMTNGKKWNMSKTHYLNFGCVQVKEKKTQINLYNLSMTRITMYHHYSIIDVWFNTILLYNLFKNGAQVLKETCSFLSLNFWLPKQQAIEQHRYGLNRSHEMHELQNT